MIRPSSAATKHHPKPLWRIIGGLKYLLAPDGNWWLAPRHDQPSGEVNK